jgi:hypothetical protein
MTEEVDHERTLFFLYVFSDPKVTFVTKEGWLHADVLKPMPLELITTGIFGANFLIWLQFFQAFCVVCFLSKKDPAESTFFTNSKIVDEAGIQTPPYSWRNLLLQDLWDFFFTQLFVM